MLDNIQDCSVRCSILMTAEALQTDPAYLASLEEMKQSSLTQHFLNRITDWCNESNTSSFQARSSELVLPIEGVISSTTLNDWETQLIAKGYTVVRDSANFKIILTMP